MTGTINRVVKWVQVSGRWTKMSIMGQYISEENTQLNNLGANDNRVVILMIPGNPGNESFYSHFGTKLLENLLENKFSIGKEYLFYTVSSLNHVKLPDELETSGKHRSHDLFTLDDQIQHKLDFVRQYLPKAGSVYMFGHSIGSYMMLKILPKVVEDGYNLKKAVALFPTIQHMAISPNGVRLGKLLTMLNNYDCVMKSLSFWVDYVPESIKRFLVKLNMPEEKVPKDIIDASIEILHMNVFRNIVHMSIHEFENVVELDDELLLHKDIHFYYGLKDGWCPVEHGHVMRERLGDDRVVLDEYDCEHAFVIKEGDIMARHLVDYFE